ncbi:AIPR family protein [Anaerosinus massiliensis]|uniref:AIPR family protein n=1 Tax=Massilibacillus massiliensis TaxID=1806837 RepID=UPI000A99E08F|nr:AIPR family protein [Massilibacillus massiliensis]
MLSDKILEFYSELLDETISYSKDNSVGTLIAFKNVFVSYLQEAGVTNLADCEIVNFKKTTEKMRLDGYAYSEYFRSLTLLVCNFNQKPQVEKLGKTDIEKTLKQASKFYRFCKTKYFEEAEESGQGYKAYEYIKQYSRETEVVNIILITNNETILYVPKDIVIGKTTIKFDVWDIERLYQCLFQNVQAVQVVIRLKSKYSNPMHLIKVEDTNSDYDCYIGVISGEILAKIYKDEGQKLIERNVRSFLQATGKINKGIRGTLSSEPHMFMAYNNGISTIAESIEIDEEKSTNELVVITVLNGWQIVNGGQTTASIYNAFQSKTDLSKVSVQIKLTVIKNREKTNEIIANISKYANSQNKINMSDFSANDEYHIRMEQLSRNIYVPAEKGKSLDRWFYERARGQYLVEVNRQLTLSLKKQFKEHNPKSRCISKTVAAKCIMAWRGYPYIVSKGLETNFIIFSEMVKKGEIPPPSEEVYKDMISKVILFNECDRIIAEHKFGGFKAQQNYYTVALIGKYFSEKVDVDYIWSTQSIPPILAQIIEKVMYVVWDHFMNPTTPGINIGQWCKKEDCWELLQLRFKKEKL